MNKTDFPDFRRYRTLVILCSPLLLFAVWLTVTLNFPYRGFEEERRIVEVPEGASASRVVSILEAEGIVRSRLPIRIYLALTLKLWPGRIRSPVSPFHRRSCDWEMPYRREIDQIESPLRTLW